METKEFSFNGSVLNGFVMMFLNIAIFLLSLFGIIYGIYLLDGGESLSGGLTLTGGIILLIVNIIMWCGFIMLEPNEATVVTTWFGKYAARSQDGILLDQSVLRNKKVSQRARNLAAEPIKVNDKTGNPIMIGLVLGWKLKDTYKALFEVDSQTMAAPQVRWRSIRHDHGTDERAGEFRWASRAMPPCVRWPDNMPTTTRTSANNEPTLRSRGDEINQQLEEKLDERLALAGIEVVEARINYLAYAPEIAAVMLRRQQASAIITAREKIVEGAVSMVKMALNKLADEDIVELDDDKKAAMVSNLLVVLCGDDSAQPVVNTGTLNH